jgi:hypothetical protein
LWRCANHQHDPDGARCYFDRPHGQERRVAPAPPGGDAQARLPRRAVTFEDSDLARTETFFAPAPPEGHPAPEADRLERIAEVLTDCGYTDKQARIQAVAILDETTPAPGDGEPR